MSPFRYQLELQMILVDFRSALFDSHGNISIVCFQ